MATFSGVGTVGRDAELRTTPQGNSVVNVALAFNYGRKGQDGKRPTQWVEASLWGKQAEAMAQYITKGRQFGVTIKDLHVETYQGNNGQGSKLVGEIIDIEFVRDGSNAAPAPAPRTAPAPRQAPTQKQQYTQHNDDPFDPLDLPF